MISRLIRIYTPFICAISAIIHGVLFLSKYKGVAYRILSNLTGHSIFVILYIIATSRKMCIWYKTTNYLQFCINIYNLLYYMEILPYMTAFYAGLVTNILAVISFLIYRVTVGITKVLC